MTTDYDTITAWLKTGKYLPKFMRDFHDQKDLFKAMHTIIVDINKGDLKDISWVAGHIYVIDVFLWFMARRGYTLQKTRTTLPFRDIEEDIAVITKQRQDTETTLLKGLIK
jgi:hypothetical protein